MSKVRLTVAYNQPPDTEDFLRHYHDVHVGLARAIPGLESYEWSRVIATPTGETPRYALLAGATFDSMESFGAGLGSAEGQAAAADVAAFATNGCDMFISELAGPDPSAAARTLAQGQGRRRDESSWPASPARCRRGRTLAAARFPCCWSE